MFQNLNDKNRVKLCTEIRKNVSFLVIHALDPGHIKIEQYAQDPAKYRILVNIQMQVRTDLRQVSRFSKSQIKHET